MFVWFQLKASPVTLVTQCNMTGDHFVYSNVLHHLNDMAPHSLENSTESSMYCLTFQAAGQDEFALVVE